MYLSESTVVGITGGNSGLGLALVKLLADICGTIKVIDRSDICDDLKKYKNVEYIKCDLNLEKPDPFVADVFIYNVGMSIGSKSIDQISQEEIEKMINVNITSHTWFFKNMNVKKHVFIASVLSFMGLKNYSIYSACKAFINSFNESLQASGFDTMIVFPYKINTEMFTEMKDFGTLEVEYVAEEIVEGIKNDEKKIILPKYFKFVIFALECCPSFVRKNIASLMSYFFLNDNQLENGEHDLRNVQEPTFNNFVEQDVQDNNLLEGKSDSTEDVESNESLFDYLSETAENFPTQFENENKIRIRKVGKVTNPDLN